MTLSIGNSKGLNRKNLKVAYIAAACAAALAAGAVVTNLSWQQRSAPAGIATADIATATANPPAQDRSFVYYLAGSEQEAAELKSLLSSEGAAFGPSQNTAVMVDGPEIRLIVSEAARELMSVGVGVTVVEPAGPTVETSSDSRPASALESAIMAGVVSSEHAAWAFEATPIVRRTVSEDANMAGVLSTERATWAFPTADANAAGR